MFVTSFYSYKGGVGRSVALLNVAWELAHRGWRVVMLDLDLEAPGLQAARLKPPERGPAWLAPSPRKGFCDLVHDYQDGTRSAEQIRDQISDYLVSDLGPGGRIALLAAHATGDTDYARFVDEFSWVDFYLSDEYPGKVATAALVTGLQRAKYDYLLIDARTGLTDVRSATLIDMPDLVVLVTNLSEQSVNGIAQQLHDIAQVNAGIVERHEPCHARRPLRELTPIKTLVVGSPLPSGELGLRQKRIAAIKKRLKRPLDVQIDYVPFLALDEDHQIVDQAADRSGAAYRRLASPYHELTDAIVRMNPLAPENLLAQADELLKLGRWREALAHYDELGDAKARYASASIRDQAGVGAIWAQLRASQQIDKALSGLKTLHPSEANDVELRLGAAWSLVVAERFGDAAAEAEKALGTAVAIASPDAFLVALSGFATGQAFGFDGQWARAAEHLKRTHEVCVTGTQPLLHALTLAEWVRVLALIGPTGEGESALVTARRLPIHSSYVDARLDLAEGELLAEVGRGVEARSSLQKAVTGFGKENDHVGRLEANIAIADIDRSVALKTLAEWETEAVSLAMTLTACRITAARAERLLLDGNVKGAIDLLDAATTRLGPSTRASRGRAQQEARLLQARCRIVLVGGVRSAAQEVLSAAQEELRKADKCLVLAAKDLGELDRIALRHEQELLQALLAAGGAGRAGCAEHADQLESRGLVTRALQARVVQAMRGDVTDVEKLMGTMARAQRLDEWQWNLPIAFVATSSLFAERLEKTLAQARCPWPRP